ncbi:MAG: PAS domain S-box-containing protein/hemerythrin-like metal-binding protein [Motiliproteus sp.]|jgi:PAS domain S-box-containing protein/hemerythrin-like metal-binding protein/diguanylate cyclase (GGDEF)-like protein
MSLDIELIQACLSSIRDALIVTDDQGAIEYWSPRAEQIFGYTADEVHGKDLHRLIIADASRAQFRQARQRLRATAGNKPAQSIEIQGLRRDGSPFPAELSLSAFQSADRWHLVGTLRDITELADARHQLQAKERDQETAETINSQTFHNQTLEQMLTSVLIQICTSAAEPFRQQGAFFLFDRAKNTLAMPAAYRLSPSQEMRVATLAAESCRELRPTPAGEYSEPDPADAQPEAPSATEDFYRFPMLDRKERHRGVLLLSIQGDVRVTTQALQALQQLVNSVSVLVDRYDLYEQNSRLRQIIEQSPIAIAITDAQARFDYVNPQFCSISGYSWEELIGQTPKLISSGETPQEVYQDLWDTLRSGNQWRGDIRNRNKRGELYWESQIIWPVYGGGELVSYVVLKEDITEKKYYQNQLATLSTHDTLTGLPNERLLRDRLEQMVAKVERDGQHALLCAIDIKQMHLINESMGLSIGDTLLRELGARLKTLFRKADTLARLSGDTFVLICATDDIATIGLKIEALCADPFMTPAADIPIELYCSILELPHSVRDTETLLQHLTTTLHRAKASGSRVPVIYDSSFDSVALAAFSLKKDLTRALDESQFQMWYQPKVNILSGQVIGAEALIRWCHPERGMVSPLEFIGLAESSGQIIEIGRWVIREVIRQVGEWSAKGLLSLPVSLNISARQLSDPQLLQTLRESLMTYRVDPGLIELELTESILVVDPVAVRKILNDFTGLGLKIVLDDFGTGYSSLAYISRLPIHTVKIDQSFVQKVCHDPQSAVIVESTLSMCRNLGLNTVAEGVETEAQGRFMSRHGCHHIQGYLFSKPVPAADFSAIVHQGFTPLNRTAEDEDIVIVLNDEQQVLNAVRRALHYSPYRLLLTTAPEQALEWLASYDVGVVITDQRMAAISGVEFLRKIKLAYPDTSRIILSGYTDLKIVTQAINEGSVFRFLSKPWDAEDLKAHIDEGFYYYKLRRSLLKKERLLDRIQRSSHLDPENHVLEIDQVDTEHAQLFNIHNQLTDAFFANAGRAQITALYQDFTDACRQHFEAEEALMTAIRYPAVKAHQQEHANLLARLLGHEYRLVNEYENVNQYELICFLRNSAVIHIREYDRPFARYQQSYESEQPLMVV